MKTIQFFIYSFLLVFLSSCGLMYKVLLGVDSKPQWEPTEKVIVEAKKYNISREDFYYQDTVKYNKMVEDIYKDKLGKVSPNGKDALQYASIKKVRKDDLQPVQFRLFKKNGEEIFKMVNCYVDPPIPMNWNVDGCFDTFPARTNIESLNTHFFNLDLILKSTKSLEGGFLQMDDLPKADYYGVVLWNNFFKRPSKKLIKKIQKYVEKTDEDIHVFYIYNQYAFLWPYLDYEQKHMILEGKAKLNK